MSSTLDLLRKYVLAPVLIFFVLPICVPRANAEQIKNLRPQGYVNDFAGVLSPAAKQALTSLCTEVDQKTKAQIAVVTVSSLEGEPVEQFAIDLATQWGVGPKQQARGILILVAPNDHQYRIEVGYGLEPILPDGKVGGFGREAVPFLRRNDYDGAILLLTQRVAAVIAQEQNVTLSTPSATQTGSPEADSPHFSIASIVWILFVAFLLFSPGLGLILRLLFGAALFPRRRGGWGSGGPRYGGGSWGGGSWGGGGGGGGFGGFGGGSFGGGGASGRW